MKVKVQDYRGSVIEFDTDREIFSCFLDDYGKESKSFTAVKKGIDDFLKDNNTFNPFLIINKPDHYRQGILKVIGIRKDGRFISENEIGQKVQVSESDEKSYIIYNPEIHDTQYAKIAYLETLVSDARNEVNKAKAEVIGISLREVKANYLPEK